jgi:hypothetical protein
MVTATVSQWPPEDQPAGEQAPDEQPAEETSTGAGTSSAAVFAQSFDEAMRNAHQTLLRVTSGYAEAWERMTDSLRRTVSLTLPRADAHTGDRQWSGTDFQIVVSEDGKEIMSKWSHDRGSAQAFAASLIAADRRAQQLRAQQQTS